MSERNKLDNYCIDSLVTFYTAPTCSIILHSELYFSPFPDRYSKGEISMNKQVLIEKLNMTYSWIERMISQISEDEMTQSIVHGERTPKDILAHIAAWNWNGIEWIKSVGKGEKPLLPIEGHTLEERDSIFARLNEEIHKRDQNKHLKDVLEDYYQSWKTMMNLVETLKQEDLDRTIHLDWAANPIEGWNVVHWRVWHAENHGKHIDAWLETKS